MDKADVLVIGAGASGLMAAKLLAQAGKKVVVLEARERFGGRIHTIYNEAFFKHAELGAEFVHGDLPVTLNLLKEAGIDYYPAAGQMWRYKKGEFTQEDQPVEGWNELIAKLKALKADTNIDQFLQNEFADDRYLGLRRSVKKFVSGYDTADPAEASAFALREEWGNEDEGDQYRIKGGYGAMIQYLADEIKKAGGSICLNSVVKKIHWKNNKVNAITDEGVAFEADKVLIAVPLGVLQATESEEGAFVFNPPLPGQSAALKSMGFGAVIKILIEFEDVFWEDKNVTGADLKQMGYLFTDETIPTWWTQHPQRSRVLTGWLGGPPAAQWSDLQEEEILESGLQALSNIFKKEIDYLKDIMIAFNIVNWTKEPFSRGSYAYDTVASAASRKVLNEPVDNTIFFAGEYLYEGPAMGTVEAALTSGKEVTERMMGD